MGQFLDEALALQPPVDRTKEERTICGLTEGTVRALGVGAAFMILWGLMVTKTPVLRGYR